MTTDIPTAIVKILASTIKIRSSVSTQITKTVAKIQKIPSESASWSGSPADVIPDYTVPDNFPLQYPMYLSFVFSLLSVQQM